MKKFLPLVFISITALSLFACSNNSNTTSNAIVNPVQLTDSETKEREQTIIFAAYFLEVMYRDNEVYEKYKDYTDVNKSDWQQFVNDKYQVVKFAKNVLESYTPDYAYKDFSKHVYYLEKIADDCQTVFDNKEKDKSNHENLVELRNVYLEKTLDIMTEKINKYEIYGDEIDAYRETIKE